ncbi:hypothetical protein F511_15505 [Dorcoceras hygrometricum]|uniref:Uncharacterized protein n=1 Tax=Dorcoceras hygrometricum TaxID=472368 RepID=A0A2Z7DGV4_9LAMI|nr:hypothetical protein F511_15505 [Dorcoceras hygrometricum]
MSSDRREVPAVLDITSEVAILSRLKLPCLVRSGETTEGRFLRTPHQLQANVRKCYPNEASQQEESNATTLTSIGAVYRRQ